MSKSKKYKVYNGKKLKGFYEKSMIFILLLLFVIGILMGALNINKDNVIADELKNTVDAFTQIRGGQGIWKTFAESFFVNGIFQFVSIFLAFSVIGYPFILLIPLLKGLGIGAFSGFMYSSFGWTGVGYCLLIIYPGVLISTFALINSCNDSCVYTKNLYLKAICSKGVYEKDETRIMLIRQVLYLTVTLVSSITDSIVAYAFSRFFEI